MSDALYQATAPVIVRALSRLSALLDKAVEHGIPEAELMEARLAPDMLPFPKQIQLTSDTAKGAMGEQSIEGKVSGDTLTWSTSITSPMPMTLEFNATVSGDAMSGTVKLGAFGSAPLSGVRA